MAILFVLMAGIILSLLGFSGFAMFILVRYRKFKDVLARAKKDNVSQVEGPDVIIVGGGYFGSTLATMLARDGRKVTVIEKDKVPNRIVGQFLLPRGLIALEKTELGITPQSLEGNLVHGMSLQAPNGVTHFKLKHPGMAVAYNTTVKAFKKVANEEQLCTFIDGTVKKTIVENGIVKGVQYRDHESGEMKNLYAPLTVISTGIFSRLSTINVARKKEITCNGLVVEILGNVDGFRIINTSVGPLLIFARGNPRKTLFILSSSVNQVTQESLLSIGTEVPEELRELFLKAVHTEVLKPWHGFYRPPSGTSVPGVLSLGDASSSRDPITASGLTIALQDALMWRQLLQQIPDLYNYDAIHAAENVFAIRRKSYSFVNDLLALMFVIFTMPSTDAQRNLAMGFGYYVSTSSPERVQSWVDIMCVLETRPHILLGHLLAISMNAMLVAVKSESWWTLPRGLYKATAAGLSACYVTLPHIWYELQSTLVLKSTPNAGRTGKTSMERKWPEWMMSLAQIIGLHPKDQVAF